MKKKFIDVLISEKDTGSGIDLCSKIISLWEYEQKRNQRRKSWETTVKQKGRGNFQLDKEKHWLAMSDAIKE